MSAPWKIYEDAACRVIEILRKELRVRSIESKQMLGGSTGANWEVDAKAWCEGSNGFLLVEVRRYTTSRLKQEGLAALAFRLQDVGASGGIVVTPLPLQEGAKLIAKCKSIEHITLSADSTPERYLAEYMGVRYRGMTFSDSLTVSGALIGGELRSASDDAEKVAGADT